MQWGPIILAALTLIGTLVGFYVKRWWINYQKEQDTLKRQEQEQKDDDSFVKNQADSTSHTNESINKQDEAQKQFEEQDKTTPVAPLPKIGN
jgi:hypothetical protein